MKFDLKYEVPLKYPRHYIPEMTAFFRGAEEYQKALDEAKTLAQLRETLHRWQWIAWDAKEKALKEIQGVLDFHDWRHFLEGQRQQKDPTEEEMSRFGEIILPAPMLEVSLIAENYNAPWGVAFQRWLEVVLPERQKQQKAKQ